ncbi:hypothetical protein LTR35_016438 [Friedmanniomyces endolithicus]|uniref:PB1 domain-containing protein n=1 Tax=Friedmanniomyces endolithicus TaxID=329885 RepID=A0AAN6F9K0_9PEZI|nr:hypothetical protein LTR35_016438 [Friedmanniomyces endolithicus]KAK0273142.1 hypothetical protein LTS00_015970 [Friedmanniomyces endolithicus]KAK0305906.1 hypothetical protein LTR82_016627 [Friedmanniomyces endolithicus]KAK0977306.1 hypothetical protein LTR54_016257 [Friedmanniomyces endolithicus]
MSLKQEIETWVAALAAYDNNEFDSAQRCFGQIADTSKILFNMGVLHATLGEHGQAVDCYQRAVQLDQYLAVAYFQQGVSNFLMGDFEEALANFNDTLLYLRGNNNIDYEQLGLKFKLYSCEVLFNRGLCYIYLQQKDVGMQDLIFAAREKSVPDHDVIEEAIKEQAEGYTVFSIPVGVIYRPNEAKVKNLKIKDYLGKARLVAAQDRLNVDPRRQAALAAMALDDRPGDKLSYAALNLVRPDLRSRSGRQQSEPPLNRNMFPPTPPPELDPPEPSLEKRHSSSSGHSSLSSLQQARPSAKPLRLDLGVAAFEQQKLSPGKPPRLGTKRSESERPALRREQSGGSARTVDSRKQRQQGRLSQRGMPLPEIQILEDPLEAYSAQASAPQQQQKPQQQLPMHQRSRSSALNPPYMPIAIAEENEDEDHEGGSADSIHDLSSDEPLAFEIIPPRPPAGTRHRSHSRRPPPPEIRKIRIKVHAEDMRYVMTTPSVTFAELTELIRLKYGLGVSGFRLKIKDEEGDLVTLSDQEDLEMAVGICRVSAAKERAEMGKMEVWMQEVR